MPAPDPTRRSLLTGAASVLLAGCANMSGLGLMRQTVALVGKGKGQGYPRDRSEIDALPYAQLGVWQGDGPRAVLVLAEASGEELSWVSGNRVQIVTLRNRIIRTTGLRSDLGQTELQGPDIWDRYDPVARRADPAELLRRIRIEPGRAPPAQLRSRVAIEGEERIDVLGVMIDTLRVREEIDVPIWRWQATNRWWMSRETRIAWRSVQHLTPDQPPLHIEVLKRPA